MVIGLGNFGSELVRQLALKKVEVVGIDKNKHRVEVVKDIAREVYIADFTEKATFSLLPIMEMDKIVITIGENVGDSIVATTLLIEEIKNEPIELYCRAINEVHKKILQTMGIQNILTPEIDSSVDVSYPLAYNNILSAYTIGLDHLTAQITVPSKYIGLKLKDIPFQKYGIQLLLVREIDLKEKGELTYKKFLSYNEVYIFKDMLPEKAMEKYMTENHILLVFAHKSDLTDFIN